ncbi:transposase [Rhizobium tibeticum]|uniref:Transposase n=2 Tax=Rhizobium tibeticum TaxID=501024 RepID=A0ABY1AZA7_9HYPH|nr:transposase [Rhizobium tibeticum]
MTAHNSKIEVLSGSERRHQLTAEKLAIYRDIEIRRNGSMLLRRYGIQTNQLFTWRMLAAQEILTATASQESYPNPTIEHLQNQVEELQRPLGKKTIEGEILNGPKKLC